MEVTNGPMKESCEEEHDDSGELTTNRRIFRLFTAGFAIFLIGVLVLVAAAFSQGDFASAGVVIFIGPIPIAFGVGPDALLTVLVSVVLIALSIILFFVLRRKARDVLSDFAVN